MSSRAVRPRRGVVEAMAHEGYLQRFPKGRPESEPPANVRPALRLLGADVLHIPYCGRVYELGHVSFVDGLRLAEAQVAVESLEKAEMTPENAAAYLRAMRMIVSLAPRYLLPVTRVRRLLWRLRLRRNPFRSATDAEVGHLLGFFSACRTRSRVQFPAAAAGETAPTS